MSKKRTVAASKGTVPIRNSQSISISQNYSDRSVQPNEQTYKNIDELPDDKVRILQDNLVFVNALPSEVSSKETLMNELHFERYGPITKLILNPPYPNKKGVIYQAYATYTNHLDAALAIVALDGYKLSDRPLKVSFGTTKYCSHFIRGNSCPNPDCFYLHSIDKKRQVQNGDTRTIFKEQNAKAMTYVLDNLNKVAQKINESDIEDVEEGFPSVTQTLDYLIDNQELLPVELEKALEKAKSMKEDQLQIPTEQSRVQSMIQNRQHQPQKQVPKLLKSNSHSTMCTPSKIEDLLPINLKKKQERTQKKCQTVRLTQKQRQPREISLNKQNHIGKRQLKLQEQIQKLIIKEIWKKGNTQCRSRFVKGVTASREECSRLKGIVQKFLIAQN